MIPPASISAAAHQRRWELLHALESVVGLAKGSKIDRLRHAPTRYLRTALHNHLVYPQLKRPLLVAADTFFGMPLRVALPAGTDLYLTGGKTHVSEQRLARFMIRHLPPEAVYGDVGAHYGFFAGLVLRLTHPEYGEVHAFEPAPDTFALLRDNLTGSPARLYPKVVAERAESLTFYQFPARFSEYNSLDVEQYRGETWFDQFPPRAVNVGAVTLDETFTSPPDWLKVDVEGAEDRVIEGGGALLRKGRTVVAMEYLADQRKNDGHRRAAAMLASWGYGCYRITAEGLLRACPEPEAYLKREDLDSDNFVFVVQPPPRLV